MKESSRRNRERIRPSKPSSAEKPAAGENPRILHRDILNASGACIRLIAAYQQKVLSQRTRTIRLLGRKNSAQIIHTLLGYEVQASYKRIQCPDLVTARYLRLFSELGFHSIKLPYDPTMTARLIPDFEAVIDEIVTEIRNRYPLDIPRQNYVIRTIYGIIRKQLAAL